MAIRWDDYIEPLIGYIRSYIPLPEGARLKTSSISDANRLSSITSDLPEVTWATEKIIVRSEQGLLGRVSLKGQKFLLLSTISDVVSEEVDRSAQEAGLIPVLYDDAFFLFCVKELQLQVRHAFNSDELKASLCFDENKKIHTVDFDLVRAAFGNFYVWQIGVHLHPEDFLVQYLLVYNRGMPELRSASRINVLSNSIQNFEFHDVAHVAQSIIRPITEVTEREFSDLRISIKDAAELLPALREIKILQEEVVFRPGGGVFFQFLKGESKYLGISIPEALTENDLVDYLADFSIVQVDYNDAEYVTLMYQLRGALGIRKTYLGYPQALLDRSEVNEQLIEFDPNGLKEVFDDVFVFDLSNSSLSGIWNILLKLALKFRSLSSPFVSSEIRSLAKSLSETNGVNFENVYLSITASHWKHSFLEAFRLIEGLYYFGWMNKLKISLGSRISEFELARRCKDDLSWKGKERPSIQNLFALVPHDVIEDQTIRNISSIQHRLDEAKDRTALMRAFGGAVYSIRNSGVHQGDLENETKIMVTAECWPRLTECIFKIVLYFYSDPLHKNGMPSA
jgi:hypothetical protein